MLGCTHYPLLEEKIAHEAARICGRPIAVVDSGVAAARELEDLLRERGLENPSQEPGTLRMLVTDRPGKFAEVASRFLGESVEGLDVEQVDL